MDVSLQLSPTVGIIGQAISGTLRVSNTAVTVGRVELWAYNTPNVTPISELGWYQLASFPGQSGTFTWNPSTWPPGTYKLAVVVFDQMGTEYATWNPANVAVKEHTPLISYTLQVPGTTTSPVQTSSPTTPGTRSAPLPKVPSEANGNTWENWLPWIAIGAAGIGAVLLLGHRD